MTSIPLDDLVNLNSALSAELRSPAPVQLKGFSTYYLSKKPGVITATDIKNGIKKLRPGLFARIRQKTYKEIEISNPSEVLILKPRRNSTNLQNVAMNDIQTSPRRFVLIIHNSFKTELQRKHFSQLVEQSPLIRVRPGILLAPQIPVGRFRRYEGVLLRPSKFIFKVTELGSPVWFVPRLEAFHPLSDTRITRLIHSTFNKRVVRIIKACHQLHIDLKTNSPLNNSKDMYKKRFNQIRRRLRFLRWQSRFFKHEFGIDIAVNLNRAILAVSRVHQRLKLCEN